MITLSNHGYSPLSSVLEREFTGVPLGLKFLLNLSPSAQSGTLAYPLRQGAYLKPAFPVFVFPQKAGYPAIL